MSRVAFAGCVSAVLLSLVALSHRLPELTRRRLGERLLSASVVLAPATLLLPFTSLGTEDKSILHQLLMLPLGGFLLLAGHAEGLVFATWLAMPACAAISCVALGRALATHCRSVSKRVVRLVLASSILNVVPSLFDRDSWDLLPSLGYYGLWACFILIGLSLEMCRLEAPRVSKRHLGLALLSTMMLMASAIFSPTPPSSSGGGGPW